MIGGEGRALNEIAPRLAAGEVQGYLILLKDRGVGLGGHWP